jgi:hypothetical protein
MAFSRESRSVAPERRRSGSGKRGAERSRHRDCAANKTTGGSGRNHHVSPLAPVIDRTLQIVQSKEAIDLRHFLIAAALLLVLSRPAAADTTAAKPPLAGIAFLVGSWGSGEGKVADTGGTSRGTSTVTLEVGGAALLRRDHTQLFGKDGKPSGSFDQIMLIYPEGGTLHADYTDGDHIIHYTSAAVVDGQSVAFTSTAEPNAPTFRLSYELKDPKTLFLTFEIQPPGAPGFAPIASGTLHKVGSGS